MNTVTPVRRQQFGVTDCGAPPYEDDKYHCAMCNERLTKEDD